MDLKHTKYTLQQTIPYPKVEYQSLTAETIRWKFTGGSMTLTKLKLGGAMLRGNNIKNQLRHSISNPIS